LDFGPLFDINAQIANRLKFKFKPISGEIELKRTLRKCKNN